MIRIVSDGTPENTVITADGEVLEDVAEAHWSIAANSGLARVTLVFHDCEVDVKGESS